MKKSENRQEKHPMKNSKQRTLYMKWFYLLEALKRKLLRKSPNFYL